MLTHIRLRIPTEKQKCLILGGNVREGMGHSMEEEENSHQMWPCLYAYSKQESVGRENHLKPLNSCINV